MYEIPAAILPLKRHLGRHRIKWVDQIRLLVIRQTDRQAAEHAGGADSVDLDNQCGAFYLCCFVLCCEVERWMEVVQDKDRVQWH